MVSTTPWISRPGFKVPFMSNEGAEAVLVLSTPLFINEAKRLAELGLRHKLLSLYGPKHHVEARGLMSYSPDRADLWRRGAGYVDKISDAGPIARARQAPGSASESLQGRNPRVVGHAGAPSAMGIWV
jgi:putative ABC transport system substrate-binding protein